MAYLQWIWGLGTCLALACATPRPVVADDVDQALHGNATDKQAAIDRLREMGPPGLERLVNRLREVERQLAARPDNVELKDAIASLDQALDRVGGAKYCRQSALYWYTDLEQAKAAALAEGKPILALRMLGNLTDDFSCANSRFFRATLYANAEISKYLRENYVLTWKSIRPVPKVTIDFGDGRKLERTLTGNSIHYILTPDGQVVDALPGLYGPAAFLAHVMQAGELAREIASLPSTQRAAALVRYHQIALTEIVDRWQADLERAQGDATPPRQSEVQQSAQPTATAAVTVARPKADVEPPLLAGSQAQVLWLEQRTTEEIWERIARLHADEACLDDASRRLVATHALNAAAAGRLAITKRVVENPLLRLVRNLQQSISLDTVKNEYTLHRRLHAWLAETPDVAQDIETLNQRVYAELFLTPSSDPWLGLAPPDVYTALPNNGVVVQMP